MPRGLLGRIVVSFLLAIVCFCGSTLYASWMARTLDEEATRIAGAAVPAIEQLSDVRHALRNLDTAVLRYAAKPQPPLRAEVDDARERLDESFERYIQLPNRFDDDQSRWATLHHRLAVVDRTVLSALALIDTGGRYDSDGTVKQATDAAAGALNGAIERDAQRARELALRIEQGRRKNVQVALLLDLLSTVFTAVAAWLTVRALAHHHRIVDERNQLAARRAEELEQFAGRVAHDVLGPLSATRLAVDHAARHVEDPALQRTLERGRRGVERVAVIVDGLLRFARAGARPEPGVSTKVPEVVAGVLADLEPVAEAAGVTLATSDLPACAVPGNAGVLVSVLENLMRNAIKYMGEREVRRVELRVQARVDKVRFEVQDTGPGIPVALQATVFDPHVRGRTHAQPGIGLGLATVKRIVEAHGGAVGLVSRPEDGCTFWCDLPRVDVYESDVSLAPPAVKRA